ncbi:MAG: N-acetyltransferase family protein [Propionibacteriales bacterium]|nr:N-acetyltransferase family protein [Propionibacteriales bacterium]
MVQLRAATPSDLSAIAAIYNQSVLDTTASWDYQPWTPAEHADWYAYKVERGFPLLVAVEDGQVLGYASYGEFRHKVGFDSTREHSVYVAPAAQGRGVGRDLMLALIDQARANGVHVLVGGLSADNEASLKLHAALGFVEVARMPEVGRKFDRWLDLVFVQLIL